jgi:hypothetical protein
LHEKETGVFVGTITDTQLQFLIDQLEEESIDDTDYYIDQATLDLFEEVGAFKCRLFSYATLGSGG